MSQERKGFRLDAKTMALALSKPEEEKPKDQKSRETQREDQEQEQQQEEQQQQEELVTPPVDATAGSAASFLFNYNCKSSLDPLPTEHFRQKLITLQSICGSSTMNSELNKIFLKRLDDIDAVDNNSGGDGTNQAVLRLVTYQDWVDLLLHSNYIIVGNMSAMERETYGKVMDCFQSVRGEQHQSLDENRKLRKDMCAIIKLVQEAYHHNNWNTEDTCLETLTVNQLLGIPDCECRPESETEKVNKCMKSLANEVASKHDEVCQLQSQLVALDEVVQTARQKLILKDKAIAQLNQQLMELQDCVSKDVVPMADYTGDTELVLASSSCLMERLNEKDQQASELLRMLNIELTEFIDLLYKKDFEAMESRRKLLCCFFERIYTERSTSLKQLENLREQLQHLDSNMDPLDTPVPSNTNILEEGDSQLIDAVRRRLCSLNEGNRELNAKCHRIEAQYKVQLLELKYSYDAEHNVSLKNCEALKEIADLLSKLCSLDLSYEEIYSESNAINPFCKIIIDMHERLTELENNKREETLRINANDKDTKLTPAHTASEPITTIKTITNSTTTPPAKTTTTTKTTL